jgi:hypothetical protein
LDSMANPEHLAKLKEGLPIWNQWRALRPILAGSNPGVDLRGADLSHAKLHQADLSLADLFGANLHGAGLAGTNLARADLRGADLTEAVLAATVFSDTDLTGVTGMDKCIHMGPSSLDFRTLQKSGTLPLSFLRGCGLPETLIEYLPSLLKQPIQFYSCFISYSTQDQEFAERLYADLQSKGAWCWFAPHDVQGGKKLHEQIVDAIRLHDRLLLILSPDSMDSEWVRNEIFHARQRERNEKRRVLFPIRLVSYEAIQEWGSEAAPEIAEYFIPDFSNWKDHDSYKKAFERLVKDLKATDKR